MKLFATAESKRKYGEGMWDFDRDTALEWVAAAACQDAETSEAYQDARDAWKASEPRAIDFVPEPERAKLQARYDEIAAKQRADFEATWGQFGLA